MQYRKLGRTDLNVSALSIGTMTFGEQFTEAEAFAQMDMAFDAGVNLIDTAELYPIPRREETLRRTEQIVAKWMKARKNRDKCLLATKVVGRTDANWFRADSKPARLTRSQIFEACDRSLTDLQTDVIDLYQVHWPDRAVSDFGSNPMVYRHPTPEADETPIAETASALDELVKAGKVRAVGVSNESAWGIMRYITYAERDGLERIASIQNAYSLINRTYETALAEISMREDIGLLVYSAMAWGHLAGHYAHGTVPPGRRRSIIPDNPRYTKPGSAPAVAEYLRIAKDFGHNPAQMAIAFAASRPFTASVILGCSSLDQLRQCLEAVEAVPITDDLRTAINEVQMLHGNPAP